MENEGISASKAPAQRGVGETRGVDTQLQGSAQLGRVSSERASAATPCGLQRQRAPSNPPPCDIAAILCAAGLRSILMQVTAAARLVFLSGSSKKERGAF